MSILQKYKRWNPLLKIDSSNILDVVLSMDNSIGININGKLTDKCLISYIETNNDNCIVGEGLASDSSFIYENSVNEGVTMEDIGLTGMDNGVILFDKDEITNAEFYDLLTKTKIHIPSEDYRFKMNPVSGNTKLYDYEMSFSSDTKTKYYALKGGFFQGFYKLDGLDYQVLPHFIDKVWHMEFTIRPQNYEISEKSVNKMYPENSGIFFYMGTRAENKFAQFYDNNINEYPIRDLSRCNSLCDNFLRGKYFFDETIDENDNSFYGKLKWVCSIYNNNQEFYPCRCDSKYVIEQKEYLLRTLNYYINEEYVADDFNLKDVIIDTSNGSPLNNNKYYEIETDNKFLFFNRREDGFTTNNWEPDTQVVLTGLTPNIQDNYYLLFNRTARGYTVKDFDKYDNKKSFERMLVTGDESDTFESNIYKVENDLKNNAFALKINDDMSIGYRYLIRDCDNENGWSIKEEKSFPNIIKNGEWNVINVMFMILNGNTDKCGSNVGKRKMKIMIYVNGYLKFISQELDEFNFRALNDNYVKQEGVPFNISLGGGSQGLLESIWLDYYKCFENILPIEQNFCGSFIGDIKSFKFYNCLLEYNEIKNNFLYEMSQLKDIENIQCYKEE